MAKDPAFPFYAQDYLVDTLRWSRGMKSLHIDLMAESWANGSLKDEGGHPAGLDSTDVEHWLKIKHKWFLENGAWKNQKLEEVRAARKIFLQKQSEKGQKSAAVRKNNQPNTQPDTQPKVNSGSTVVEPYESENEIEIEKKIKVALDEVYLDKQKVKWQHIEFDFEVRAFIEKVRGSPDHYKSHDVGGLRLALQAQLRNAKHKSKNGTSKTGSSGITAQGTLDRLNSYRD